MPESAQIVLGAGYGDYRKGIDLFIETAQIATKERKDIYFIWVGNLHLEVTNKLAPEVQSDKNIILQSALERNNVEEIESTLDVFDQALNQLLSILYSYQK